MATRTKVSMSDILNKFIEELKTKDNPVINIILHDAPDPDAVGSALGVQHILKHFGFDTKIYYGGEISHPQNKTIVNLLNVTLNKVMNGEEKLKGINICVDCSPANSFVDNVDLIIDHHKINSKCKHQIVNANYGACATIVWRLIKEFNLENTKEDTNVFTALLLGIRTDTNDLISEKITHEDFTAYQELLELSDKEAIQKVMNYPFPRYLYERRLNLHEEGNFYEANGVFVGGIGVIPSTQRDVIAILAEEYTRMESISTAVIFAITDKKFLEVSVRSTNVSLDVNQMCKDLFGNFGGGASYKGAAKIPLNFYADVDEGAIKDFWKITCNHMFKLVLKEAWKVEKKKDNKK